VPVRSGFTDTDPTCATLQCVFEIAQCMLKFDSVDLAVAYAGKCGPGNQPCPMFCTMEYRYAADTMQTPGLAVGCRARWFCSSRGGALSFSLVKQADPPLVRCGCLRLTPARLPHYRPVCGTDGQTYGNLCSLRSQACKSPELQLSAAHEGECAEGMSTH
jgi:hypothetical protein